MEPKWLSAANPFDIAAMQKDLGMEFIINAYFSVDSFFFVGGVLLTFLWFVHLNSHFTTHSNFRLKNFNRHPKATNSPTSWLMVYVHRILRYFIIHFDERRSKFRLSPPFYMILVFYAFVIKQLFRDSPINMNIITQLDGCKYVFCVEKCWPRSILERTGGKSSPI